MTSYLNSLSSHYTSLKRLIPTSLSPDSDLSVTDPEDSHVSRVLRAYYTEKGRPYPPWLGADPRAPQQAAPVYANAIPQRGGPSPATGAQPSRRGLGDLFGEGGNAEQPQQQQEPASLRRVRRPPIRSNATGDSRGGGSYQESAPAARPLPSQRAGSNQSRSAIPPNNPLSVPQSELQRVPSAQNRLRARFGAAGRQGSSGSGMSEASSSSGGQVLSANARWQDGGDPYGGSSGSGGGGGSSSRRW